MTIHLTKNDVLKVLADHYNIELFMEPTGDYGCLGDSITWEGSFKYPQED